MRLTMARCSGRRNRRGCRVAALGQGGYGAHFDEAEAQRGQRVDVFAVFVEAGGEADGVGQGETHKLCGAGVALYGGQDAAAGGGFEGVEGEVVGFFGVEAEDEGAEQGIHGLRPV